MPEAVPAAEKAARRERVVGLRRLVSGTERIGERIAPDRDARLYVRIVVHGPEGAHDEEERPEEHDVSATRRDVQQSSRT